MTDTAAAGFVTAAGLLAVALASGGSPSTQQGHRVQGCCTSGKFTFGLAHQGEDGVQLIDANAVDRSEAVTGIMGWNIAQHVQLAEQVANTTKAQFNNAPTRIRNWWARSWTC